MKMKLCIILVLLGLIGEASLQAPRGPFPQGYNQQGSLGYNQQGSQGYNQQGSKGYTQQGSQGSTQQFFPGYNQQGYPLKNQKLPAFNQDAQFNSKVNPQYLQGIPPKIPLSPAPPVPTPPQPVDLNTRAPTSLPVDLKAPRLKKNSYDKYNRNRSVLKAKNRLRRAAEDDEFLDAAALDRGGYRGRPSKTRGQEADVDRMPSEPGVRRFSADSREWTPNFGWGGFEDQRHEEASSWEDERYQQPERFKGRPTSSKPPGRVAQSGVYSDDDFGRLKDPRAGSKRWGPGAPQTSHDSDEHMDAEDNEVFKADKKKWLPKQSATQGSMKLKKQPGPKGFRPKGFRSPNAGGKGNADAHQQEWSSPHWSKLEHGHGPVEWGGHHGGKQHRFDGGDEEEDLDEESYDIGYSDGFVDGATCHGLIGQAHAAPSMVAHQAAVPELAQLTQPSFAGTPAPALESPPVPVFSPSLASLPPTQSTQTLAPAPAASLSDASVDSRSLTSGYSLQNSGYAPGYSAQYTSYQAPHYSSLNSYQTPYYSSQFTGYQAPNYSGQSTSYHDPNVQSDPSTPASRSQSPTGGGSGYSRH